MRPNKSRVFIGLAKKVYRFFCAKSLKIFAFIAFLRLLDDAEIDRIAERVLSRIHIRLEDEALKDLRDLLNEIV